MKRASWADRARYAFDNFMAKGTIALIGGLFVASALMILAIAGIVVLTRQAPEVDGVRPGFLHLAWMGLLRTLDTGTMGGDEGSPLFLAAMLAVTVGGVFTVSMLIGILNSAVEGKLEELRKGRSRVIESGHTVILGWSQQVFPLIAELVIANQNQRRSCIVVLGNAEKVAMEDAIRDRVGTIGNTHIVCRSGNPIEPADLEIVSPHTARAIILLSPESDDPDSDVIKALLAITNSPTRKTEPYHIVAEMRDPKNMEVARIVGGGEVELLLVGNLISRIIAQTCRQSGLSVVYTELLDFGGDEIYFHEEPALVGKTFGEALLAYEDSAVIGLHSRERGPALNPPADTVIQAGDQIIAISEDDDTVRLSGKAEPDINREAICPAAPVGLLPESTLILGWNWRAPAIIKELDSYVGPDSRLMVVASEAGAEAALVECRAGLKNQTVNFLYGDTTDRRTLDGLEIGRYNHVILLCYSDTLGVQQADARTLITLLHLREIAGQGGRPFSIVSEMLDVRNRRLAEVTRADDFIVSDRLVSLMLSQIAENKRLNAVFSDIFDPEGSEVYLKPAPSYVQPGVPVNFYTVVEAARQRGEVALGYRMHALAGDPERAYGVVINPEKSRPVTFAPADRIVVLAEG